MLRYVFDTGALIAAERGKPRAARFIHAVRHDRADMFVPTVVVSEWWRGRTRAREELLAIAEIVGSLAIAKAAGVALAEVAKIDAGLTIDAVVMATAAMLDAVVLTGDPDDFAVLGAVFPTVTVLAI